MVSCQYTACGIPSLELITVHTLKASPSPWKSISGRGVSLGVGFPIGIVPRTQADHHEGGCGEAKEVCESHGDLLQPEDEGMNRPRRRGRMAADKEAEALL